MEHLIFGLNGICSIDNLMINAIVDVPMKEMYIIHIFQTIGTFKVEKTVRRDFQGFKYKFIKVIVNVNMGINL